MRPYTQNERWLLALLFAVGAWIRLHDLGYNSAFNDESINVLVGRDVLAGELKPNPIPFYVGWYLFPLLAWWSDQLGGVVGMRAMTGIMGLATVWSVSHITRRVFGNGAGIAAVVFVLILSPFVFAGRVAFREAGTICFLAVGAACFVEAWTTDQRRYWAGSALSVFAAFLCKHPIGIYGPPMVLLAIMASARGRVWFAMLLTAIVSSYVLIYRVELLDMWHVLRTTPILFAPDTEIAKIYGVRRLDVYGMYVLAALGFALDRRAAVRSRLILLAAATLFAVVHVTQRADLNTYRHAAYVLMFLIPLGVHAISAAIARVGTSGVAVERYGVALFSGIVAIPMALAGRDWHVTKADVAFEWPNNTFSAEYLRAWTAGSRLVLVDDQTLRYELWPDFRTHQITDAFYYAYQGLLNGPAYAAAVRDGVFDFVVFDGASYDASTKLRAAILPELGAHYVKSVTMADSLTGQPIEVYRRVLPAMASPGPRKERLQITEPATGSVSETLNVAVRGVLAAAQGGERVQIEVYTNQWWPQGTTVAVDPISGIFESVVSLGGVGAQRCHHLIRARAFDARQRLIATTMVVDVARVNPNDPDPRCERT